MHYLDDILILIGIVLIAASVYILAGWPGIVLYAGVLCVLLGMSVGALPRKPKT